MHPAWIEFIEYLGKALKGIGTALARLAERLKAEPGPKKTDL
ncbi:MAG TPA: hypothetical protein VJ302_30710 [Blastocatellia bacterium]|nr:hypothetical protein [Blastocatellia bacterium]